MEPLQFCYWLQGYFEIAGERSSMDRDEVVIIKEHLQKVFNRESKPTKSLPKDIYNRGRLCSSDLPTVESNPDLWEFIKYTSMASC